MNETNLACTPNFVPAPAERTADGLLPVYLLALATVLLHLAVGNRYGFHRDELQLLADARRLRWGYVVYPPLTPFLAWVSLHLFGTSLRGFRLFANLAQAACLVLTGMMARELGGKRWAPLLAAAAALPFSLAAGAMMQYVSFDNLFWVLTAYSTIRLLKSGDPRWCLAVGAAAGGGLLAKYAMPFLLAGVLLGLLLCMPRIFRSRWFWMGIALAAFIALPNFLWQVRHHFVYLDFIHAIHTRDVAWGRARGFLLKQFIFTLLAAPLWLAGLWAAASGALGKQFRAIAVMYLTPLLLFWGAQGRWYYMMAAYPMLYAAGAVWLRQKTNRRRRLAIWLVPTLWAALALDAGLFIAFTMPLAPPGSHWFQLASHVDGDLKEEVGWRELVSSAAAVWGRIPAPQRARAAVLGANYGEAGALDLYGARYDLPPAISGVNSFWYRGYPHPAPLRLVVLGFSQTDAEKTFSGCELAGHVSNRYGVNNEEARHHPDIFLCGPPRAGWPAFWRNFRYYG